MTRIMRALRAASITALTPLLCAQTLNLNDLLASMRKRIETADFRATGHLVWVRPNGDARSAIPSPSRRIGFPACCASLWRWAPDRRHREMRLPVRTS